MVHRLELLRHAKSSWDDPGLLDHDRPLAPRGIKACARLREHLRRTNAAVDLVLCSSATRAVQTWDGVRGGLAGKPTVRIEDLLYTADASRLLARLSELPEAAGSALLVGHNPALEQLATQLAGDGDADAIRRMRAKYPTGGLASLAFDGPWEGVTWGCAHLEAFVVPRALK